MSVPSGSRRCRRGDIDREAVAEALAAGLATSQLRSCDDVAVAFTWARPPSFWRMDAFLADVHDALAERTAAGKPTCLVKEGDLGRSLRRLLSSEQDHPVPVISVDGVSLSDFDFVDIGALMPKSGTVPCR